MDTTSNQTRVSENPPYNTAKSTRPVDKHEDRSRTSSHRSGRYKEKFHQMREKYDQATAKREEYLRDINIGEAKVRQLQAENDLLLDAMYIAIPMQSQSVERKPSVFNIAEFQPHPHRNGIPLALERSIPTSNNSDPNTTLHPNPHPNSITNTNVISITNSNSNASPEPESIPVSGPVPPSSFPPPLHPQQQPPQVSQVSGSFPQQLTHTQLTHTQTHQQPPGAPQQPPTQTQISLNIVNVPPSVARGAHFSPHPTHMNGSGSGSGSGSTPTLSASASTGTGTASTGDPATGNANGNGTAAPGRRRTSQRHGRLKFVSHDANGRIA